MVWAKRPRVLNALSVFRGWRNWTVVAVLLLAAAPALPAPADRGADASTLAALPLGRGATLASALRRFEALQDGRPLWSEASRLQALCVALAGLADDGLPASSYGLGALEGAVRRLHTPDTLTSAQQARIEVQASAAYLLALYQLRHGVLDADRFYPDWQSVRGAPDEAWLRAALEAAREGRIARAFAAARPPVAAYAAMRSAMARLRGIAARGGWPQVPAGPTLRLGMDDPAVVLLRQRLMPEDARGTPSAALFGPALESEVRAFQRRHGLASDGRVGPATRAALNVPVTARMDQLALNLERARWYLGELPDRYVQVDIANFELTDVVPGHPAWSTRVQVGQPRRPTPVLRSAINQVTLDPAWTVPPTILRRDILPKLRHHPRYLERNDMTALDAHGRPLDARHIDWTHPPAGLVLRQAPGPEAALGKVALRFPNRHDVYLHDTPHQALFASTVRAFSSGCVRVEDAMQLAAQVLDDPGHWSLEALTAAADRGRTRELAVRPAVPLRIIYWTVHVDPDGAVGSVPDLYAQDGPQGAALAAALARQKAAFDAPTP